MEEKNGFKMEMSSSSAPSFPLVSHGLRPTKGNGRKRKGVEEYVAEHWMDFTSQSIIRDGQVVQVLVCRFCCQCIGARSDRIKEHLASKKHGKLKMDAFREVGPDLSQAYSVGRLLPEPPITMVKVPGPGKALPFGGCREVASGGGVAINPKPIPPLLNYSPQHQHHPPGQIVRGGHYDLGTPRPRPPPPPSVSSFQQQQLHHQHPSSLLRGDGGSGRCSTSNNHQHSSSSSPQQLLCVRWGNFDANIVSMFSKLRSAEHFLDVTLWCEGKTIKCHKLMLSACSTYFEKLLTENPNPHPIIFLKDMRFWEITALVEFIYKGEVSVHQEQLQDLLRAAESLQIKGLGSPSANYDPVGDGTESRDELDGDQTQSDLEEDLSMDMPSSTTTATPIPNINHTSSSFSQPNSFSNQLINSFNSLRGSSASSLPRMKMGMDLSQGSRRRTAGAGDLTQSSLHSLPLSSSRDVRTPGASDLTQPSLHSPPFALSNSSNPAKRKKNDTPLRLFNILPARPNLSSNPVFSSSNMMAESGGILHFDTPVDEEYDAEPPPDDEMTIHEPEPRPRLEQNFKQEPELLQHHHIQQVGKMQQQPSSYEEDEDQGDGQENYGDHGDGDGAGLKMDESKSDSEGKGDLRESPEDTTTDHQPQEGYKDR